MAIQPVHTITLYSFVLIIHNVTLGPLHSSDLCVWAPGGESQCEVSTQGNLYTVSSLQPLLTHLLMFQVPCEAGAVASPRLYLASVSPLSLGVLVVIVLSLGLGLTVIRRFRRQTEPVEGEEGVELQVIFRQ